MSIEHIRERVFEDAQLQLILDAVVIDSVASQFSTSLARPDGYAQTQFDWSYLLSVASLFAGSERGSHQDLALRIAQFCLQNDGTTESQKAAAAMVIDDLENGPGFALAERRNLLPENYAGRLPLSMRMRSLRNRLSTVVELSDGRMLHLTRFQYAFWQSLTDATWISVSAPTSAGKSYVVGRWIVDQLNASNQLVAVVVPTRALISQVESDLRRYSAEAEKQIHVTSIPRRQSLKPGRPNVLVFTQERLHLFLTAEDTTTAPPISHLIVDEAQKVGDRHRGVMLQLVIETLLSLRSATKVVFVSPMTSNPGLLTQGAPSDVAVAVIDSDAVTVNQNLLWVSQVPRRTTKWDVSLCLRDSVKSIGTLNLTSSPTPESKRLPFVAHALANGQSGNVVYVNGAADAEKTSLQLYDLVGGSADMTTNPEINQLIDLVKYTIHPDYLLRHVLNRGIAFHYGNIPLLVRTEVERLFTEGAISFLVCTSTLVEGVNTSCKTISVRGPQKGRGQPMNAEDFWNLAGRAGRLGKEFQGNIACVDANKRELWYGGAPPRTRRRYTIERTTESILSNPSEFLEFVAAGTPRNVAVKRPDLEYVLSYLMLNYAKNGSLSVLPWAHAIPTPSLDQLNEVIGVVWSQVDIPPNVAERSPGISPIAMQSLLDYFRSRTTEEEKPVEELLPADPGSEDAAQNYTAIIGRCAKHLNAALGPPGKRSFPLALLVTRWMRGFPLARLIDDRVKYEKAKNAKPVDIQAVIRSVLDDVERIARFEAPRTFTAYIDVLRIFLTESDRSDLMAQVEDIAIYLELGVSIPTQISLMAIGLSRSTAIRLSEVIADDTLNEDAALTWLRTGTWELVEMPEVMKREVREVLESLPAVV